MSEVPSIRLPALPPAQIADAVQAALTEDPARASWLRAGAAASIAHGAEDAAARRFQTVLELCFLVASADGFADAERVQLARLLESITEAAIDRGALELHFTELDAAVNALGRRERMARLAADIEGSAAVDEALAVATLVALADGELAGPEYAALVELGELLGFEATRVRSRIDEVVGGLVRRLEANR
ncbi:MAG: hypothetical protein IPH07_31300 [Deltaproteobacteria bacterium]|nr:hypothetical protein [Deltaproteobacteria bacterium]MBK8715402.1 hypothetical protein [Deltaproteobacteria bacterium]MBP7287711.1 hypothetical protein [Nannocystaceae bacterium]